MLPPIAHPLFHEAVGWRELFLDPSTQPLTLRRVIPTGTPGSDLRQKVISPAGPEADRQKSKQLRCLAELLLPPPTKLFTGLPIPIEMRLVASPRSSPVAATSPL